MEIKAFFEDPIHREVSKTLNERVLTNRFTYTAANLIIHWTSEGIIDDLRGGSKSWRRFSIIEIVWLGLINELRELGLSMEKIKNIKKDLLAPIDQIETTYPYLEYHLIVTLLYKKPYFIIVDHQGGANIVNLETYIQWLELTDMPKGHIVIKFESLFNKLLNQLNKYKVDFSQYFKLSKDELELLSFIKQNDFQTIKIIRKERQIDRLEGYQRIDNEKRIIDILNQGDYQNIEVIQENGKVVSISRKVKKRIAK